ncbi:MAG TPA: redoxin domain-containing protein [Xanthomonadaceae bacterium]|nr:redoxin domain-containing protein [Xanthomonadaceae bacterium]
MDAVAMAPELSPGLEWVNGDPQRLESLRGSVVALGFWSAGSAWCHNLLKDLQSLQNRHADGFAALAVHTPKFEAERDGKRVLKAVNRLGVRIPVASDPAFLTWQHYGVEGWPTLVLIDPAGQVRHTLRGEVPRASIEAAITQLLQEADEATRSYDAAPSALRPEPRMALAFPSGLVADDTHLYVADSGHHRILECNHEGRVLRQFGSANPNFLDGHAAEAGLESPRGLSLWKDALFVADTGNHAVRRVRLLDGDVETLVGSGERGLPQAGPIRDPRAVALDQPWDVACAYDRLYIALAGNQQIWEYDLGRRRIRCVAGSGRLALGDGVAEEADCAQPAGLALIQQTLYFTDSAASAVRSIQLTERHVQTLVGHGLFDFGDSDGPRSAALLQYPTGLALDTRAPILWIADSYNNQLRMLRLGGGDLRRFDLGYRLHQPVALAASAGRLWIANTNAHEVLRLDIESGVVRRLPIGE